jgi:hypothetical protein
MIMANGAMTVVAVGSLMLGCVTQGDLGTGNDAGGAFTDGPETSGAAGNGVSKTSGTGGSRLNDSIAPTASAGEPAAVVVPFGEAEVRDLAANAVATGDYEGTPPVGCEQRLGDFEPVEVWTGYIENYGQAEDQVELRFAELDDDGATGEVRFGSGPWEARYHQPATDVLDDYYDLYTSRPDTGFVYSMLGATLEGRRLRFRVEPNEPWCAYCGQFPPIHLLNGDYACAPADLSTGSSGDVCYVQARDTGAEVRWPCDALNACVWEPICECTRDGCTALGLVSPARSEYQIPFDVTLESPTLARGSVENYNVRFDIVTPGAAGAGGAGTSGSAGAGGAGGSGAIAAAGADDPTR